jgi:hypothetical protein
VSDILDNCELSDIGTGVMDMMRSRKCRTRGMMLPLQDSNLECRLKWRPDVSD